MATDEERVKAHLEIARFEREFARIFPKKKKIAFRDRVADLFWAAYHRIKNLWRDLRSWDEKRTKGYADEEWWEFNYHHAKWCLPRLMKLRKNFQGMPMRFPCVKDKHGFPDHLTSKEWYDILGKMCRAFYLILKRDEDLYVDADPLTDEYIEEGLKLFYHYYRSLWD